MDGAGGMKRTDLKLPDHALLFQGVPHYTADQMREYGRACERAAYERAVKKCEEFEDELQTKGRDREADVAWGLARRIEDLGEDK